MSRALKIAGVALAFALVCLGIYLAATAAPKP